MPKFDLFWRAEGTATVEADDVDEAKLILYGAVDRWDAFELDGMDVEAVEVKE